MKNHRLLPLLAGALLTTGICLWSAEPAASAPQQPPAVAGKPIPRLQAIPEPYEQIAFRRQQDEVARFHYSDRMLRPFVHPIIGPAGKNLTRMGHPHDPHGHRHHYSFWVAHNSLNGVNFWMEEGKGRILCKMIETLEDGDAQAAIQSLNAWVDEKDQTLLSERRRLTLRELEKGEYLLILDMQFEAAEKPAVFGKTPFGLAAVRVAKTMGVNDGGGRILNSDGLVNEKAIFRKKAKWVDYSGQSAPGVTEGITLMDHPSNINHPAPFHVRDDGWMGACLTFENEVTVAPGKPLRLRYALYVHSNQGEEKAIGKVYDAFKAEKLEPLKGRK